MPLFAWCVFRLWMAGDPAPSLASLVACNRGTGESVVARFGSDQEPGASAMKRHPPGLASSLLLLSWVAHRDGPPNHSLVVDPL